VPAGHPAGTTASKGFFAVGGVTLSRWTMSYFAAALAFLMVAQGLMVLGYGFPAAPVAAPETLVMVHIVAIGWLSLLMCGALFQFVPVLVARPIHSNSLPLPTLLCLLGGLAGLLLGFLQLAGTVASDLPFFPIASVLLGAGFALALWNLGRTLWMARPLPLPARFVVIGLLSIGATATLGIIFALVLGGATTYPYFLNAMGDGLAIHVIAGLGGWLTFTAMGVSYRLLAMFMLAPELDRPNSRAVLHLGTAALAIVILGGAVAIALGGGIDFILFAAALFGMAALVLYGRDIVHLYRARKRRIIELNSRMAGVALVSLVLATILTIALLYFGKLADNAAAVVFLVSFGWLSGLGLAKLYKIVAFLTWLECYGPVLGKTPTPRVQDLVVEQRALKWFLLYFLAVWAATIALLTDYPLAFRAAAALMTIATCGIVVQLVRARRLADVKAMLRFPNGARKPRLLQSLPQQA
jgi:hypothetical protein